MAIYQGRRRPPADEQFPKTYRTLSDIGGLLEEIRQVLGPLDFQVFFTLDHHLQSAVASQRQSPGGGTERSGLHRVPKGLHWTDRQMLYWLKEHHFALRNRAMAASTIVEHALSTGHVVD